MSIPAALPLTPVKPHKKHKHKHKHEYGDEEGKGKERKSKKRKGHPTQTISITDPVTGAGETEMEMERVKKKSKHSRSKGKHREEERERDGGEFIQATSTLSLSLPPYYMKSPLNGAISVLDGLVMRYIPSLSGILLSHSNARFVQSKALVQADSPFMKCDVMFECVIWSPRIGMKLRGYHSISSPSHISLLVHRTFNVSIPSSHIPQASHMHSVEYPEMFHFEFRPATTSTSKVVGGEDERGGEGEEEEREDAPEEKGYWISSLTGIPISGSDDSRSIEFTVIGLTVANSMLSLIGSLQEDPFDARHAISTAEALEVADTFQRQQAELERDQMELEREDEDIEEVEMEGDLSVLPGGGIGEGEDDEIEGWTQDTRITVLPDPDSAHPLDHVASPPLHPMDVTMTGADTTAAAEPVGEGSKKKRKRKDKDKAEVRVEAEEKKSDDPPKKKKKKVKVNELGENIESKDSLLVDEGDHTIVKEEMGKKKKKKKKQE